MAFDSIHTLKRERHTYEEYICHWWLRWHPIMTNFSYFHHFNDKNTLKLNISHRVISNLVKPSICTTPLLRLSTAWHDYKTNFDHEEFINFPIQRKIKIINEGTAMCILFLFSALLKLHFFNDILLAYTFFSMVFHWRMC